MGGDDSAPSANVSTEPLSCSTCRLRKVRCNRIHPCINCIKGGFECTFPSRRRRPRETRQQLALRLEKLESHLQDLAQSYNPRIAPPLQPAVPASVAKGEPTPPDDAPISTDLSNDVGSLDIDADRSRYSSNALWATLSQEINEMHNMLEDELIEVYDKDLLNTPSDNSSQGHTPDNPAWLFPQQNPTAAQSVGSIDSLEQSMLWTAYVENVAPLIKIFHAPSIRNLWLEALSGVRKMTAVEEVALNSVYFAGSVSLQDHEAQQLFNKSKAQVIQTQRQILEQFFQQVDVLNTGSVMVLQAFILYLVALRRLDDTRLALSLLGFAIRLATNLGLQRDGSRFKIDAFDAEVRRRIWWQLSLLDFELSNDHGVEPMIRLDTSDTALPSNINDDDIYPGMAESAASKNGFTGMSQSLVRFEISITSRRLLYTAPGSQKMALTEQRKSIEDLQGRIKEQYLKYCSSDDALQWSTTLVARSKITMLWVSMYHQLQHKSASPSRELNNKMMTAVTEIVENVRDLEINLKTLHWGWYFHNDVQWVAILYLLNEIIRRPPGALSDRAWDVLKRARDQWYENCGSKQRLQGMLFKPMRALTNRAFWIKEGKQPPSRMPASKIIDSEPDFSIPEDFNFVPTQYLASPEYLPFSSGSDITGTQAQPDLSGFEAALIPAGDQMETFMMPLWNQDWQFLSQNVPP